jgi:uncharacterized membrane protein YhhN
LPEDATPRDPAGSAARLAARVAILAAVLGVLATWTRDGRVRLDGLEGPDNGWLVLIVAAFALAWTRSMARGSRIGVVAVLGAAVVMGWAALETWLDSREAVGARIGIGLLLVLGASVALGLTAAARSAQLRPTRR